MVLMHSVQTIALEFFVGDCNALLVLVFQAAVFQ